MLPFGSRPSSWLGYRLVVSSGVSFCGCAQVVCGACLLRRGVC